MQIALSARFGPLCLKLICLLSVTAYIAGTMREYIASYLGTSQGRHAMQEAIALEPSNAEYRHSFGSYFVLSEQRPDLAIPHYRSAVTLNPHLADYWLDLAKAYASTGDAQQQRLALERALEVDPKTPAVFWEVANAFLMRGDVQKAFRTFRFVLDTDPSQVQITVQICWYATQNLDMMISDLLPPIPGGYLELLRLVVEEGRKDEADKIWSRLVVLRQRFDPRLAMPYVDYLIAQHDIEHARAAWGELGRINPEFWPYLASAANLVVNGGFEREFLNTGFDWRQEGKSGVTLAMDAQQFHSGRRSLSLVFNGGAVLDTGASQSIAVDPDNEYKFTAYARTDNVLAAQGPQFVISEAY